MDFPPLPPVPRRAAGAPAPTPTPTPTATDAVAPPPADGGGDPPDLTGQIARVAAWEREDRHALLDLDARLTALERRPPPAAAGPTWLDWLGRLSSRRYHAFWVAVATPVSALAAGRLSAHDAVLAIVAAAVGYMVTETATDLRRG
jgi:hypothetical protein